MPAVVPSSSKLAVPPASKVRSPVFRVPGLAPAAMVPPLCTVTVPSTVPVPPSVPPDATVTVDAAASTPVTASVPAEIIVVPV